MKIRGEEVNQYSKVKRLYLHNKYFRYDKDMKYLVIPFPVLAG